MIIGSQSMCLITSQIDKMDASTKRKTAYFDQFLVNYNSGNKQEVQTILNVTLESIAWSLNCNQI